MKQLVLVLSLLTSIHLQAQTWVQSGATWHYDNVESFSWVNSTPFKYEYLGDSLIENKNCQKFIRTDFELNQNILDSTIILTGLTYVNGDTVFYRHHNRFFVLFNFGAQIGDSWIISDSVESNLFSNSICGDTSKVTVTNAGIVSYDGTPYRTITLKTEANSPYYLNDTFIERFGILNNINNHEQHTFIFPKPNFDYCQENIIIEWVSTSFDCYYDDNFRFNPEDGCGFYLTSDKKNEISRLSISPNPTQSSLQIKSSINNGTFQIFDVFGKMVSAGKIDKNLYLVDVSNLINGVYFITITDKLNQSQNYKFIKN